MAYPNGSANGSRSSAELEREINEQRTRIEARIGEIKNRLSPGQLLDEALSYTRHGGAHFATNLGQQISANPIPAALVGVGLAWLMAGNMNGGAQPMPVRRELDTEDEDYPYAIVPSGTVTRVSHAADESGEWWSEFEAEGGTRYKARSDKLGNRAGHFMDDTGKTFSGLIDQTGQRVRQIRDQSGSLLDDALGWTNHNWGSAQRSMGQAMKSVASGANRLGDGLASGTRQLGDLGGTLQSQADQLSRQMVSLFEQQPLIAGALAFAAGAALGATLPHTPQEDEMLGEEADRMKRKAGEAAGQLYRTGKEQASEIYEEATSKAGQVYEETRDRAADIASSGNGQASMSRH
jgi:hypothetical protein